MISKEEFIEVCDKYVEYLWDSEELDNGWCFSGLSFCLNWVNEDTHLSEKPYIALLMYCETCCDWIEQKPINLETKEDLSRLIRSLKLIERLM